MHQQMLCAAIKARKNVYLKYEDDMLDREFSPYIVYYSTQNNLTVAGYQVKNPAEPLEANKWRTFTDDLIKSLRHSKSTFVVDQTFKPFDKRYGTRVICHVKQNVY